MVGLILFFHDSCREEITLKLVVHRTTHNFLRIFLSLPEYFKGISYLSVIHITISIFNLFLEKRFKRAVLGELFGQFFMYLCGL